MVKKKDNLKEIKEEEPVIEMGPVNDRGKNNKIIFFSILLSSLSLILVITLFFWFQYKKPFSIEENLSKEKQNLIKIINEKEIRLSKDIDEINDLIIILQKKITTFENFSKENKDTNIHKNNKILNSQIEEIKIKIQTLNKKIIFLEKENEKDLSLNLSKDNDSNPKILDNYEIKKIKLLEEFNQIKLTLFNKKTYSGADEESDKSLKNIVLNYLSGFLNLRDYRENENPRSLLTKAETSAVKGNLKDVISNLERLPEEWKNNLEPFIQKSKKFLNSDRMR